MVFHQVLRLRSATSMMGTGKMYQRSVTMTNTRIPSPSRSQVILVELKSEVLNRLSSERLKIFSSSPVGSVSPLAKVSSRRRMWSRVCRFPISVTSSTTSPGSSAKAEKFAIREMISKTVLSNGLRMRRGCIP